MPDLDLETEDGPTRVAALLHAARPVLLHLGGSDRFEIGTWADRVELVEARADAQCELPVVGSVDVPPAVLLRPDGHVAWAGEVSDRDLPAALTRWFGTSQPRELAT